MRMRGHLRLVTHGQVYVGTETIEAITDKQDPIFIII